MKHKYVVLTHCLMQIKKTTKMTQAAEHALGGAEHRRTVSHNAEGLLVVAQLVHWGAGTTRAVAEVVVVTQLVSRGLCTKTPGCAEVPHQHNR